MKVRLTIDASPYARYVIAKYFHLARGRATRANVRAFVEAALVTCVREQAEALPRRQRAIAVRLRDGYVSAPPLREPSEKQIPLRFTD